MMASDLKFCTPDNLDFLASRMQNHFLRVLFNRSVVSDSLQPHGLQHTRLPCRSLSAGVFSNSCPLSQWGRSTISSSVTSFFSWLQFFSAPGRGELKELMHSFLYFFIHQIFNHPHINSRAMLHAEDTAMIKVDMTYIPLETDSKQVNKKLLVANYYKGNKQVGGVGGEQFTREKNLSSQPAYTVTRAN